MNKEFGLVSENNGSTVVAQYEGLKRKHILCMATGEIVDECITGLLKEEFIDK